MTTNRPFSIRTKPQRPILRPNSSICLTGFQNKQQRRQLIATIAKLGARHCPELTLFQDPPTHLVVHESIIYEKVPSPKIQAVMEYNLGLRESVDDHVNESDSMVIHVVSSKWLEQCLLKRKHLDEVKFCPLEVENDDNDFGVDQADIVGNQVGAEGRPSSAHTSMLSYQSSNSISREKQSIMFPYRLDDVYKEIDLRTLPLSKACDLLLKSGNYCADYINCPIFSHCQFFLLGFDNENEVDEGQIRRRRKRHCAKFAEDTLSGKMAALLRMGLGTNCWDIHERLTHIIVNDDYEFSLNSTQRSHNGEDACTAAMVRIDELR